MVYIPNIETLFDGDLLVIEQHTHDLGGKEVGEIAYSSLEEIMGDQGKGKPYRRNQLKLSHELQSNKPHNLCMIS